MKTSFSTLIPRVLMFFILPACDSATKMPEVEYAGNPISDGWYADPEAIIYGDTYWIYPTYSAPFSEQVFMDCFSSKDLVNWTKHERIIDTAEVKWADSAMWAPGVIENTGKYYLCSLQPMMSM